MSMLKQPFTMDYYSSHCIHGLIMGPIHSSLSLPPTNAWRSSPFRIWIRSTSTLYSINPHYTSKPTDPIRKHDVVMVWSQPHRQVGTTTEVLIDFTWLHHSSSLPSSVNESLYVPVPRPLFYHVFIIFYLNLNLYVVQHQYLVLEGTWKEVLTWFGMINININEIHGLKSAV